MYGYGGWSIAPKAKRVAGRKPRQQYFVAFLANSVKLHAPSTQEKQTISLIAFLIHLLIGVYFPAVGSGHDRRHLLLVYPRKQPDRRRQFCTPPDLLSIVIDCWRRHGQLNCFSVGR
jgi:hypothetical protein